MEDFLHLINGHAFSDLLIILILNIFNGNKMVEHNSSVVFEIGFVEQQTLNLTYKDIW